MTAQQRDLDISGPRDTGQGDGAAPISLPLSWEQLVDRMERVLDEATRAAKGRGDETDLGEAQDLLRDALSDMRQWYRSALSSLEDDEERYGLAMQMSQYGRHLLYKVRDALGITLDIPETIFADLEVYRPPKREVEPHFALIAAACGKLESEHLEQESFTRRNAAWLGACLWELENRPKRTKGTKAK